MPVYGTTGKCPDCTTVQAGRLGADNRNGPSAFPASQPGTRKRNPKRGAASFTPPPEASAKKKIRSVEDYDSLLSNLDSLDRDEIIIRLREAVSVGRSAVGDLYRVSIELAELKSTFDNYKIAFADNAFKLLVNANSPHTASSGAGGMVDQSTTLVLDISEEKAAETFDAKRLDSILDSKSSGPVVETITRNKNKIYLSFKDALESGKAVELLEKKPECSTLFRSVVTKPKFYSLVALHADISDLKALEEELLLRNSYIGDSLKLIKIIYRSKTDPSIGHVKLLFDSAQARDFALARGKVFAAGRRINVVETDWNKEVRRCFKCQKYGHIAKSCAFRPACGRCAQQHETKSCDGRAKLQCVNCNKNHRSGDPACNEQIKAVKRFRATLSQ